MIQHQHKTKLECDLRLAPHVKSNLTF